MNFRHDTKTETLAYVVHPSKVSAILKCFIKINANSDKKKHFLISYPISDDHTLFLNKTQPLVHKKTDNRIPLTK